MLDDPAEADALVHAVARDWRAAPLTPADRALCEYAARLTHAPSEMTPADLDALRAHGFDDRALHDAVQVMAYFNYINRIADGLGVEPEAFIRPWGEEVEGMEGKKERMIEELESSQRQLAALLTSVAEEQHWRPAPEAWSLREIAAHLATTEKECFQARVVRIAAGENPHFEYYLNAGRDFGPVTLREALQEWAATRREILDFVRGLPGEKWSLGGTHATFGRMTLLDALRVMRDHDREHLRDLERTLQERTD